MPGFIRPDTAQPQQVIPWHKHCLHIAMPRRKMIYTSEFPYHVSARSNNKEWFYVDMDTAWNVFIHHLNRVIIKYQVNIHSFVLMNNHYHMIIQTNDKHKLGTVMCDLQKSVSRTINAITGRINHVFGGPYKGSLVTSPDYYHNVYKYVYRNPIEAGIVQKAEAYAYSTLTRANSLYLTRPLNKIDVLIDYSESGLLSWINEETCPDLKSSIKAGLKKTHFKYL